MEISKKNKNKLSGLQTFIRRHHFVLGFVLLAIVSAALGAGYSGMSKKLAERPGEVKAAIADIWTPVGPTLQWRDVDMSGNCQTQTAVANNSQIYVSTDRGSTWQAKTSPIGPWVAIAMSLDGVRQTALIESGNSPIGGVYVSTDSGTSWTAKAWSNTRFFRDVAMSNTGQYQTVTISGGVGGSALWVSNDYGDTFTQRMPGYSWGPVAMNANGDIQVAAVYGGQIWVSYNYGVDWNNKENNRGWWSLAVDDSGDNLLAGVYGGGAFGPGTIYYSFNQGNDWYPSTEPSRNWWSIDMPGSLPQIIGAVDNGGRIYNSWQGNNWVSKGATLQWQGIAVSNDGNCQTAVANNDRIYISDSFDFALGSVGSQSVNQGQSVNATLNVGLYGTPSKPVTFSHTGLPAGATISYAPASVNPSAATTLTINSDTAIPGGPYSITVTGTGGGLSRTSTFALTINPPPAAPCNNPWGSGTTPSGNSTTAYSVPSVACGASCAPVSQTRTCNNGSWSSPFTYTIQSCTPSCANCLTPWSTWVSHGAGTNAYSTGSVACGNSCPAPVWRTCNNGTLSGSGNFGSCSVQACVASCTLPWGGSIASGANVTAYSAPTVACGSLCSAVSETRTCTNGTLSGSYTNQNCSIQACSVGSGISNITWDNLTTGANGTAIGTTTWLIGGVALQSGINNIILTILDNAGNSSSTQLTVNYTPTGGYGSGGNVNGWGWSAGTGWINFSASNTIAIAPVSTRHIATAIENAVEKTWTTVTRVAKFFKLNFNRSLATNQTAGLAKYVDSFVDSFTLSIKIALAQAADFGVSIDTDGQFSGYAWSDAVGWIYFGPDDTLPTYGNIASSSAPSDPKTWAKWSQILDQPDSVTGWANILALGADGWIKMSDNTVGTWVGKGVTIKTSGDFDGWAWNAGANGAAGIGWISFNATACSIAGVTCPGGAPSSFKVTTNLGVPLNQAPTAINLSAPNWASSSAKTSTARHAFLRWDFSDPDAGDTQTAYRVVLYNLTDSNIATDTSKFDSPSPQFDASAWIGLNKKYRWDLYVWDSNGASSTAISYNSNSSADTDGNADGDGSTFETFTHEFPRAYFDWTPKKPSAGQDVVFDGRTSASPDGYNLSYDWSFSNMIPLNASGATTTAQVEKSGTSTIITLTVTDDGTPNYSNSTSTNFTGKLKLPTWTEQKP